MREPEFYIGKPVRSLQTMLRVLAKARKAPLSVVPDGIYGGDTARAVSSFQKQEGLPVTGEADSVTWRQLRDAFDSESPLVLPAEPLEIIWNPHDLIRPGERSLHLYLIQAMLKALGQIYMGAPLPEVSGVHDEQSVAAIKWLQKKCALPETGSISQNEWLHLTKLYRLSVGDGKKSLASPAAAE